MAKRPARFKATATQMMTISAIVDRAQDMGLVATKQKKHWYDRETALMDLDACISNGCPLKLKKLLEAPDFDFSHDICGIARHMDRDTGKLRDFFNPRCARRT